MPTKVEEEEGEGKRGTSQICQIHYCADWSNSFLSSSSFRPPPLQTCTWSGFMLIQITGKHIFFALLLTPIRTTLVWGRAGA